MSNIYEDECTFIKSIVYFVWRGGGGGQTNIPEQPKRECAYLKRFMFTNEGNEAD